MLSEEKAKQNYLFFNSVVINKELHCSVYLKV